MRYTFDKDGLTKIRGDGGRLLASAVVERLNRQESTIARLEKLILEQAGLLAAAEARFLADHPQPLELSA